MLQPLPYECLSQVQQITGLFIGCGAVGMTTALAAAERRHRVTLFEKNAELGGGC